MSYGIYKITNKVNNKCYIGKSKNPKHRISTHKWSLKKLERHKDTNRHLFNAAKEYGLENFIFEIIETGINCPKELADKELRWMDFYNSCNRDFGYNLRRDSSSQTEVHAETKLLFKDKFVGADNPNYGHKWSDEQKDRMSKIKKEQYASGQLIADVQNSYKGVEERNKRWVENPTLKTKMAERVSDKLRIYNIAKLDYQTLEVIEVYEGRLDLKNKEPTYYTQAILGCCSGTKNSYKGFKWKYLPR